MTPVRRATMADLEDMTRVHIAASPDDPIYGYRYPNRATYPDDFDLHARSRCSEYLSDKDSTVVVYEAPTGNGSEKKVVAFGVWGIPGPKARGKSLDKLSSALASPSPRPLRPRRDAHPGRVKTFSEQSSKAKKRIFDMKYPRGHMFLKVLMCHPDYRRRGAGTELVLWGIRMAAGRDMDTTLFASPMGQLLYKKMGFAEVGDFKVQVEGEEEKLEIPALVFRSTRG